ncbi:hypothetical protein ES705_37034 [subsurface metagenome]
MPEGSLASATKAPPIATGLAPHSIFKNGAAVVPTFVKEKPREIAIRIMHIIVVLGIFISFPPFAKGLKKAEKRHNSSF